MPLVVLVGTGVLIAVVAVLGSWWLVARRRHDGPGTVAPLDESAAIEARADEVRSALLTAVSHDLRTPLASIKAAATSMLSHDVEWSADAIRMMCRTIDEEADRLNGVVGNLLDMSRLQTGALSVAKRNTAVDELVDVAIAKLGTSPNVAVVLPPALPPVDVDPVLVGRAITNIVDNAVRWSNARPSIAITAALTGDRVVLRVVDHGPGIPATRRKSVLRPLQRLGDGAGARDGLGLGLAVATGLVEANGGKLDLDETEGGGLTVSISLPVPAHQRLS